MPVTRVRLFLNTVRYLRPAQIYRRIWFNLYRPHPKLLPTPKEASTNNNAWMQVARRKRSLVGPDCFFFLNQKGKVSEISWVGIKRNQLWRYNQHYFDDLNAFASEERLSWHLELIDSWIGSNPPSKGPGWDPYPTSLRIVNWIKWHLSCSQLSSAAKESVSIQARWLKRRLEWHLLGNHLFANAKALVFAGLFFRGVEAKSWLETGLSILKAQIDEQILPDGGHFELSPMYHSIVMEDILDLINVLTHYEENLGEKERIVLRKLTRVVDKMRAWLVCMCHPDGEIAFFNDAAFDVSPAPKELLEYHKRLLPDVDKTSEPTNAVNLENSGYVRVEKGNLLLILDTGCVGPDYLPGHAHADTLSFELSVLGQRVLVNSGTSCYGTSAERLRQRGTSAHNTVCVNEENSSEVWGGFRVARRAKPFGFSLLARVETNEFEIECSHDGYRRLKNRPVHSRAMRIGLDSLKVEDEVTGSFDSATARFHFHPAITVSLDSSMKKGMLTMKGKLFGHFQIEIGMAQLSASTWHPEFGVAIRNTCLENKVQGGFSRIEFKFARYEE